MGASRKSHVQCCHHIVETLDLEQIEDNIFRGHSPQAGWQRVFGGW